MSIKSSSYQAKFKDNVLEIENQLLYYIESFSTLKIDHLIGYDAIILEGRDPDFTRIMLRKFRGSSNPEFYLKPIFLINYKETNDPMINDLHDGIILSFDQIPEIINDINQLFVRTTHLDNSPSNSFEVQTMKKVLNYMYTREIKSIKPIPDVNSSIGFSFPVLSVNFELHEESKILDLLDWAQKEDLIWPDFYDRVYLCNNCGSGHLNYREVCPSCNSSNMKSEDLVHHFPCGYIGAISDFRNKVDSAMSCPKCSKSLRHIGVDYDKPSVINHCLTCNEVFQDYIVKAKCVYCKSDSDVQYLVPRILNTYKLTKKGRNGATSGIITSEYGTQEEIYGSVSIKTFYTMIHYELERIKSNPSIESSVAVIYIENIFELLKSIGKTKEKAFLTEMVQIIRETITPADYISISNPSLICICINDESYETALVITQKVIDKLEEVVFNNFNKFQLQIEAKTEKLSPAIRFETQMAEITKALMDK